MATVSLPVDVAATVDLFAELGISHNPPQVGTDHGGIPPGMATNPSNRKEITGTPTTPGEYTVVVMASDPLGNGVEAGTVTITVVGSEPEPELPEAPELVVGEYAEVDLWTILGSSAKTPEWANHENVPPGMETDTTDRRRIVGTPTTAGEYAVGVWTEDQHGGDEFVGTVELSVVAEASEPDPEDPEDPEDPDEPELPDLDPFDLYAILARSLAPRVAAFVGKPGDADTIATAEAQVPVVTEYVRGYTRGRGFEDEAPAGPLRAVIVSGVARLATNPEQVAHFQTGDYSERPAQLAGWTLTELGVLRRYRRTSA